MPQGEPPLLKRNLRLEILYYRALLNATKTMLESMAADDDLRLLFGVRRRGRVIKKIQRVESRIAGILGDAYPESLREASVSPLKEHREMLSLMLAEQLHLDKEVEKRMKTKKTSVHEDLARVRSRRNKAQGAYGIPARRGVYLDRAS
ncbi:MAG: hypothetical protein HYT87_16545 [Nitrospirae bacterium]|nr:hypothetical protein [Nitrospirota bacterium]